MIRAALLQLAYLGHDLRRIVNRRRHRWLSVWFSSAFAVVAAYRASRAALLLLGPLAPVLRALGSPLAMLLRPWFGLCEIDPRADIGPGLLVLHPSAGVVISAHAQIGSHLTLAGGNFIGSRGHAAPIRLGDHILLGAHSVILGPVSIGDQARIGAGAVVTHDVAAGQTVVGIPARPV